MTVIDIHSHIFSANKPMPAAALRDPMWDVSDRLGPGFKAKAEAQSLPRIDTYLEHMEQWGIDMVCVNSVAMTSEGARAMNDFNAEIIAKNPDRMIGFAAVPVAPDQNGPRELEYAVRQLGFRGVKVYPFIQGVPLDAPEMRPIYEAAAELDVPVLTHTTSFPHSYTGARGRDWPDMTYDNPGRLFAAGTWGEIPNLRIIHAHLAGGFFYYKQALIARNPACEPWFDRLYVDMVPAARFSRDQVLAAVEALGANHVMFGLDYPWIDLETCGQCVSHVRAMELPEELEEAILGGNAAKLLELDHAQRWSRAAPDPVERIASC